MSKEVPFSTCHYIKKKRNKIQELCNNCSAILIPRRPHLDTPSNLRAIRF